MSDFKESEHPRDKDGKFTSKGDQSSSNYQQEVNNRIKWAKENNIDLPLNSDGTLNDLRLQDLNKIKLTVEKINLQFFAEKGLKNQSISELEKGIKSLKIKIDKHKYKISHPQEYYEDWENMSKREKDGAIKYWGKEISNQINGIKEREEEIKRRGNKHEK